MKRTEWIESAKDKPGAIDSPPFRDQNESMDMGEKKNKEKHSKTYCFILKSNVCKVNSPGKFLLTKQLKEEKAPI